MKTLSPRPNPIEERIQYHMACLEARKSGAQEPEAPWLKQIAVEGEQNIGGASGDPLDTLSRPTRPRMPGVPKWERTKSKPRETERSASKKQSSRVPSDLPAPPQEPPPLPSQSVRTVLSFPKIGDLKPVAMLSEKVVILESLLIRAGIPEKSIQQDNLCQRVVEAYQNYERLGAEESKTALVQKYEIGRHFCRAGMNKFGAFADVIIPLLQATEVKDLTHKRILAEEATLNLCSKS